jgi:hypothetical protein
LEKGNELNAFKNRTSSRKKYGTKYILFITIVAKVPDKIDTQNPLTVQLIKDMQANQSGIFTINRFSTSLYFIIALNLLGYGAVTDPVAWGLVDYLQKDGKIKQYVDLIT